MLLQKRKFLVYILLIVNVIVFSQVFAQQSMPLNGAMQAEILPNQRVVNDSTILTPDSIHSPSDTTQLKKPKKAPLDDVVTYSAKDSLVFEGTNNAILFGSSEVKYQDIELDAQEIKMNLDSSSVYATGARDSVGSLFGTPIFKDKSGEYESKTIDYNFKSQKGYITNIVTQQGEGFLTGGRTKKMVDNEFYMENGKYTTCDHHDCPHFYLQLTKAKVKPKKNIVTGPAYMVLADVPLYFLAIPFGYFPFTTSYSSGIIMPTYGDDLNRGFYLRDGGYYFAINDYVDLALTGEIYTKGSWGFNAASKYAARYRFNGNFNIGYRETISGDKGLPDYSKMKNFQVLWTHTQDAKANPNMTFSASVNFATSGYDRNDLNSYYNANEFTQNTKSSSVNFTYRFPDSPFSVSATANVNQRSQDSTLSVSFPDLTINMSRIYPFKRSVAVGKEQWYEKISLNYSALVKNTITTKQDQFLKSSLIKDWRNGIQHKASMSATFTALKYLNITPSINVTDRMYTRKVRQGWDPELINSAGGLGDVARDTTYGFYNVYDFSASVSMNTKMYGFYQPLPFMGDYVQMIRHVFTPSISISGNPDFQAPMWGMYDSYYKPHSTIPDVFNEVKYSPFADGVFGGNVPGKSGSISMSMQHNIEAKVKSGRDSTGVRKISIIDNLAVSASYNLAADSLKWSDINVAARFKFTKNLTFQINGVLDPYKYNQNGTKIDSYVWQNGQFPRLKSTSTSFSYTFNNDTFKKLFGGKGDDNKNSGQQASPDNSGYEPLDEAVEQEAKTEKSAVEQFDSDGYMKWSVPWSLSVNYSLRYGYGNFNKTKLRYDHKITQNLSFSGNLSITEKWRFNFSSSYDFDTRKLAYMNCNVVRDLHCWEMSVGFVPVGPYASYNFSIRVKSSLLSDLKYDKRSGTGNMLEWY